MTFAGFVLRNLLRRKGRTALTISGVAIAVATVIALTGLSHSYEQSLADLYEGRGVELVVVRAGVADRLHSNLNVKVGEKIGELSGVRHVTGVLLDVVAFEKANLVGVAIQGWPADSFLFQDLRVVSGRPLADNDRQTVLLGNLLARRLRSQVGDRLEIEGESFEVVGIYESFNWFENASAVLLLPELQRLMDRPNQVTGFQIVPVPSADKQQTINKLREDIEKLCDDRGRSYRLEALPARDHASSSMQIRVGHAMAWVSSAIALLVGAIGTLNTMLMSVLERTQEIGILRAIGWRKGRVMRMILNESVFLSVLGALIGALGAVGLLRLLALFPEAEGLITTVAPVVILKGFLLALLIGILGGAYPAFRGAQLLPTEALRHE